MEGDAEQPGLRPGAHQGGDVQGEAALSALDADHAARLLEHPEAVGVARCRAHEGGPVQAAQYPLHVEVVSGTHGSGTGRGSPLPHMVASGLLAATRRQARAGHEQRAGQQRVN